MPSESPEITVELFGPARLRAGVAQVKLPVGSVRDLLFEIQCRFPKLILLNEEGSLRGEYLISLSGSRFVTDLNEMVQVEDSLLILSADAGG